MSTENNKEKGKKKKKSELYKNIAFVAFLLILFFTPAGKEIKLWAQKLRVAVSSPSIENVEDQKQLTSYDYKWQFKDAEGNLVSLADYKGKVVVLNFWATWCPPCVAEMPSFQELYNTYNNKVVFLFVSNEEFSVTKPFMKKKEFNMPVYNQISNAPGVLKHSVLPTTFLIDQNGKIVIEESGATDWNSKNMHELLEKLIVE
ncbi:MAG: TlpA family protein disulfide reductase [Ichthyobacteriaceae bacterium]|nr:TlpA family protein disulfide reductase [Ichthyobacteriaceae bacterium]